METGTVKWFNNVKGYGFINLDNSDQEIFVHYSAISDMDGFKTIKEGQKVQFEIASTDRGQQAIHLSRIDENFE